MTKPGNAERKRTQWHCLVVPWNIFLPDTQLMSNSHKCNPLCYIMFLFTFQECGVVRGVLIRYFTFSLHLPLSFSLSFILLSLYRSTPPPLHPYPLTNFSVQPKEDAPDYFPPHLWAAHLPLFRTVDHQPGSRVMEGETQPTFPQAASPLAQHGDMHGGALCRLGGRGVSHNLLLPVMGCNLEQLLSRCASWMPSMLQHQNESASLSSHSLFFPVYWALGRKSSSFCSGAIFDMAPALTTLWRCTRAD